MEVNSSLDLYLILLNLPYLSFKISGVSLKYSFLTSTIFFGAHSLYFFLTRSVGAGKLNRIKNTIPNKIVKNIEGIFIATSTNRESLLNSDKKTLIHFTSTTIDKTTRSTLKIHIFNTSFLKESKDFKSL